MDSAPLLATLARLLAKHDLEAIMIGNSAAALQGAPVTTIDIDFLFRKTSRNLAKLKALARDLEAVILKPYYPVSGLHRISRDLDGLQVDFMTAIDGVKSLESLCARSLTMDFGGYPLRVATLAAIIESKQAAGRPQDLAVLDILKKSLRETPPQPQKSARRSQERE